MKSQPRYSRPGEQRGFTLVEIMIVVAIIGFIAALAIPNFMNSRRNSIRSVCVNNLRLIADSKEQYAIENKIGDNSVELTFEDLDEYLERHGMSAGSACCPTGAEYHINPLDIVPSCDYGDGHVIPD